MMYRIAPIEPIDYLVIGHLTRDLTPDGPRLGGTAAYSSLTARALGVRVGVLTVCEECLEAKELISQGILVAGMRADQTTTFENIQTPDRAHPVCSQYRPDHRPFDDPRNLAQHPHRSPGSGSP